MAGAEPDLLTPFILGVAALASGLFGLLARALCSERERARADVFLALAPAAFAALAALFQWPRYLWLPSTVLAGVSGLFLVGRSASTLGIIRRAWAVGSGPCVQWTVLAAAGLGLVLWHVLQASQPSPVDLDAHRKAAQRVPQSFREVASPVARTDRGRRVRLLTLPENLLASSTLRALEADMAQEWGPALGVARTSPPDWRADCHGWVFGEGRWWLLGADVELILQDNGYQPVTAPAAGDLVLYRNRTNEITHSGVVCAVLRDETVLVESKWSWLGTYVHAAVTQPYGGSPSYYRSPRRGHRLDFSTAEPPTELSLP